MQLDNGSTRKVPVIVRAWDDEPVKLFLHRIENNRCFVGNSSTIRPIGLPVDQVFWFDPLRFAELSTVFQQGDKGKLGELWANISVDDLTCNRYQDVLESLHDQENVTDSERATGRHD